MGKEENLPNEVFPLRFGTLVRESAVSGHQGYYEGPLEGFFGKFPTKGESFYIAGHRWTRTSPVENVENIDEKTIKFITKSGSNYILTHGDVKVVEENNE